MLAACWQGAQETASGAYAPLLEEGVVARFQNQRADHQNERAAHKTRAVPERQPRADQATGHIGSGLIKYFINKRTFNSIVFE